jgi:hypothetical protein
MSLRLGTARIGQQIAEEWLANVPDTLIAELDTAGPMTESAILSSEDEESPISAYYEVLELYSVNILTTLQDYSSAREFIKYNPYISDQQKKVKYYMSILFYDQVTLKMLKLTRVHP